LLVFMLWKFYVYEQEVRFETYDEIVRVCLNLNNLQESGKKYA